MKPAEYYYPVDQGLEIRIAEKMTKLRRMDKRQG